MLTKRMRRVAGRFISAAAMSPLVLLSACAGTSPRNVIPDSADTVGSVVAGHARGVVSGAVLGCWVGSAKGLCVPAGAVGVLVGGALGVEQGLQEARQRRASRRTDKG